MTPLREDVSRFLMLTEALVFAVPVTFVFSVFGGVLLVKMAGALHEPHTALIWSVLVLEALTLVAAWYLLGGFVWRGRAFLATRGRIALPLLQGVAWLVVASLAALLIVWVLGLFGVRPGAGEPLRLLRTVAGSFACGTPLLLPVLHLVAERRHVTGNGMHA